MNSTPNPKHDAELYDSLRGLLDAAVSGRMDEAKSLYEQTRAKHETLAVWSLLQKVIDGTRFVSKSGAIFYLDRSPPSVVFDRDFQEASQCLSGLFDMPVPTILVNCTGSLRGWHLTHIEVQGFALISISKLKPRFPDNLRRSIFHETAHCFLRCGIPVLDEGFAYLFSEQFSGEARVEEVEGAENAKHLSEGDKFSKLFAAGEESDAHRADLRYRQGQLLVLEIWNVIGATRLKALFQKIAADPAPCKVIRHIEDALGFPIDALCNNSPETWRLLANAWHAIANETDIASLMLTLSKLEPIAMQLTDMHVLDAIISIRLKIIRLGLYGICEVQTSLIQEFLEDLPALIEEAARSGLSPSRVWTLRGHQASILVKKYFPHLAKVSVELDKAYHCYETAFSFDASDPDLLIHFGLLKILTPESAGGDRASGTSDIRSSLDHPLWGGLARRLLNNFGLAGDVWLPFSSGSRQAVLSGVSK